MKPVDEYIIDELHNFVGICGHCGKRDCPGRQSQSQLPESISTDAVIRAISDGAIAFAKDAPSQEPQG